MPVMFIFFLPRGFNKVKCQSAGYFCVSFQNFKKRKIALYSFRLIKHNPLITPLWEEKGIYENEKNTRLFTYADNCWQPGCGPKVAAGTAGACVIDITTANAMTGPGIQYGKGYSKLLKSEAFTESAE